MLLKCAGLFPITVFAGCSAATLALKVSPRDVSGAYCAPLFMLPSVSSRLKPFQSEIPSVPDSQSSVPAPSDGLSPDSREIAEIIGVLELVRETHTLEAQDEHLHAEVKQRLGALRQHLSDSLMTIFFEVSSVANRVDCEATRANHVASALNELRERRARKYEITAIVGDALIGIVGGALALAAKETAAGIAEVIGGSFARTFGLENISFCILTKQTCCENYGTRPRRQ